MSVKILADSKNDFSRVTTILFENFPYCVLQELNTHRTLNKYVLADTFNQFSRNSASTRAIKNLYERVGADPFVPKWEREQKGMSGQDSFSDDQKYLLDHQWRHDCSVIIEMAKKYADKGVHKSKINRLLAPFLTVPTVVTGNEFYWKNFFDLRCDVTADSDFREIAIESYCVYLDSAPKNKLTGFIHCPFYSGEKWHGLTDEMMEAVVRLAKLSFDKMLEPMERDYVVKFFNRLKDNKHFSPFEHILISADNSFYKNYYGWISLRAILELSLI